MPQSKPNAAPREPFSPEEQRRRWRLIAEAILNDPSTGTDQAEKESEEKRKAA